MKDIIYFKELKRYDKEKIEKHFEKKSYTALLELKSEGYLKRDKNGYLYFDYTGIIYIQDQITAILPKITTESDMHFREKCEEHLKLTVDLLKMEQKILTDNILKIEGIPDSNFSPDSRIPLMDFFFRDYTEYGIYENENEQHIINGRGEVNWELTVEEGEAFLNRGKPVYLNLYTRYGKLDEDDYIMELHKLILNECIKTAGQLTVQKILGILDIPDMSFHISDARLGNLEYKLQMIKREMRIQFNERKLRLLKAMKLYLTRKTIEGANEVALWGTANFWMIWENACAWVFKNEYEKGNHYYEKVERNTIGRWMEAGKKSKPMRPDIVIKNNNILYIADAKYYVEEWFCEKLGVQDIAKQFMYEKSLEEMISEGGKTVNIFLVPGREEKYISSVSMGIFPNMKVHALAINGKELLSMYRQRRRRGIEELIRLIPEGED